MITEGRALARARLACALLLAGCPLPAPPAPRPIDCEEIDRAEERFPEECAASPAPGGEEMGESDGEVEAAAQ